MYGAQNDLDWVDSHPNGLNWNACLLLASCESSSKCFQSLVITFDSVNLGILPFFLALNEQLAVLMAPPSSFPKKTTKGKCK